MHLNILISKYSNLLFFLKTSKKVTFTDEKTELSFFGLSEEKIRVKIDKEICKEDLTTIRKHIDFLVPVFESHWGKIFKQLGDWEEYFQKNEKTTRRAISEITALAGLKGFDYSTIPVYFISNFNSKGKEINAWFSYSPKENYIVMEIPFNIRVSSDLAPLGILAHEFFHLALRKNKRIHAMISKKAEENVELIVKSAKKESPKMFLEELLLSSFVPEGYMGQEFFNFKNRGILRKPKDMLYWRRFAGYKLYDTAKKYMKDRTQIDNNYLEELVKLMK